MKFEAEYGTRLHRYFSCVTMVNSNNLWWNKTNRCWEELNATKGCIYSSHAPCKTLKSYKRMLRKYPFLINNSVLINRYIGYNIYG